MLVWIAQIENCGKETYLKDSLTVIMVRQINPGFYTRVSITLLVDIFPFIYSRANPEMSSRTGDHLTPLSCGARQRIMSSPQDLSVGVPNLREFF